MTSTCPEVPSFAGIRHGPAAGKRAMPARRSMPKARQSSTSAASAVPKTPVTPVTPKEELSKPNLTISVPPLPKSSQRDDGPEEGEISDEEDDHYSPREATTPIVISHMIPMAYPFQTTSVAAVQPSSSMINSFPVNNNNMNGTSNDQLTRRDQQTINTLRETDPTMMPMPELRKAAQSAVMFLACSAKMSFEEIVAEGIERRVLTGIYDQLRLPIFESSKNVPTTVPSKNTAPEVSNGFKVAAPTPTAQQSLPYPKPGNIAIPATLPTSLPPKPPISVSTPPIPVSTNNNISKPESVVSRFNQAIPGLNIIQSSPSGTTSPPLPTPHSDVIQEVSPTSQPPTVRSRKRPVAADFDTEIKPAFLNSKQPRFGNRQHLETSQLIFDVSDNEEEDKEQKSLRVTPQTAVPSRPDSTNPEKNGELEESLRLKELEIERMRQKIMAMSRKRKLAANGEVGSGPSSKPTTPLPVTPSADLLTAKESSLEKVEEFLHQTLDQISTGTAPPAAVEAAVELSTAELMDVEAKVDGFNVGLIINTPPSINSPEKDPTPVTTDSEAKDTPEANVNSDNIAAMISSDSQVDESGTRSSDDKSFATAPIDMESGDDDIEAPGSPMDLSDLDTTSDRSDQDSSDSESDPGAEDSESDDTSEQVSSDDSADVEMQDTSGDGSLESDSASSPVQETLDDDDDGYDPEVRKSTIGEVSLPPTTIETPQNQPPLIIGASESQLRTITSTNNQQPKNTESGFTPYQSQLAGFRSFRYHPSYNQLVSQGFKSLTYSNHIDSELPICDFETRGGTCNDPQCRWQHFRQMALPEDTILLELAEPDANQADKEEYKQALAKILSQLNGGNLSEFDKIAGEIIEYRRQMLGDPTRIIKDL